MAPAGDILGTGVRATSTSRRSGSSRPRTCSCRTSGTSPRGCSSPSSATSRRRSWATSWAPPPTPGRRRSSASRWERSSAWCSRRSSSTTRRPSGRYCPTSSSARPSRSSPWHPSSWSRFGRGLTSVVIIATYLTFFPVTIAEMRGLRAPDPRALELMRSYAASRWTHLLEGPIARVGALPVHGAEDRCGRAASWAPSSARARGASRRALAAPSSSTTSSTSPRPRSCGPPSSSRRIAGILFFVLLRVAEIVVLRGRQSMEA